MRSRHLNLIRRSIRRLLGSVEQAHRDKREAVLEDELDGARLLWRAHGLSFDEQMQSRR